MNQKYNFYSIKGKRLFDLLLTIPALVLSAPVIFFLSILIIKRQGMPILFKQIRPGIQGNPFTILKFRTMNIAKDENGLLLPDEKRLTKLGQLMRSTSMDELPELWNVIKGDMSLVGPRPLLMQYLERYTPGQAKRHAVKPGLTGWAQVNGRNAISWEEKFKLDVWYVDNQCFWLDLKIIALTIGNVLLRKGINQPGKATMTEFMGFNKT